MNILLERSNYFTTNNFIAIEICQLINLEALIDLEACAFAKIRH